MGMTVGAIIGLAVSASTATTSTIMAAKSQKDTKAQYKKDKKEAAAKIQQDKLTQDGLDAQEKSRAEDKIKRRDLALETEGRESTFASGQGGLSGSAPTKKKKLGQ